MHILIVVFWFVCLFVCLFFLEKALVEGFTVHVVTFYLTNQEEPFAEDCRNLTKLVGRFLILFWRLERLLFKLFL